MAEAVGAPGPDKTPTEADHGILIWVGLGIAILVVLAVVPWSILAAVAIGVVGILWYFSKEDTGKEASHGDGSAGKIALQVSWLVPERSNARNHLLGASARMSQA
jgi:hypothetical protein